MSTKEIYEIGEMPPVGQLPKFMYAQVVRASRFGEPKQAFQVEKIEIPALKPDEVWVYVMATGINFNNVWAALGSPINVIAIRQKANFDASDFHIGGSDVSGIVYAVGSDVNNVKVGDHVVVHAGWWDANDPVVRSGEDPAFSSSFKVWGYETGWGGFGQFAKAQAHQCLPKAKHLTWEEAAAPTLVGSTAFRMLNGWPPHTVRPGDIVLVWGAAGGLGCMAIQIVKAQGGIPVAVISDDRKIDFCMKLGAKGCINRKKFNHWGMMPHWKDADGYGKWAAGCRAFGKAIWDILGERRSPRIVFEHPGEDTVPTSIFVCDTAGMVVICAGTTGFNAVVDLRYLWMRQKRLQGSHLFNDEQARAFNQLVVDGKIDPCVGQVHKFDDIPLCHQLMHENKAPEGKMVALVGAPRAGLKDVA
jgi:crotonyl-CoA carboxylase/reductase